MSNLKIGKSGAVIRSGSNSISPSNIKRLKNVTLVIQRHFTGKANSSESLQREALARIINPCSNFMEILEEEEIVAAGNFGPELLSPSISAESAFIEYGMTDLGATAIERLLVMDEDTISNGWRNSRGFITDEGIEAYGAGLWRPFRVASNGVYSDAVTPSGVLMLPDDFEEDYYSTGDIANPLAIIHHELMAHVLPLKEAEGLEPGREMELICIRFESEMLRYLGLRERALNWGKDDGVLNHTLHEPSEQYYHGLVRLDKAGALMEVDPVTLQKTGSAVIA